MTTTFRHSSGFGKRIEYWVIGLMLKEGMDVYVPLVDDHAVDAIVRRKDLDRAGSNKGEIKHGKNGRRIALRSHHSRA
jgi:hypothetical protein